MKNPATSLRYLVASTSLAAIFAVSLHASEPSPEEVLNVDFNGSDSGKLSPTFSGKSPLGGGVIWNGLNASIRATDGLKVWTGLLFSDGQTDSEVQIAARDFTGVNTSVTVSKDDPTPHILVENALLMDKISTTRGSEPAELSISGLKPNANYDLALFGRSHNVGTKFLVNGEEKRNTGVGPADLPMEEGRDYVVYYSVNSGANGEIIVTAEGTGSGAHLAGLSVAPSK
jgi:hypothetical protein